MEIDQDPLGIDVKYTHEELLCALQHSAGEGKKIKKKDIFFY